MSRPRPDHLATHSRLSAYDLRRHLTNDHGTPSRGLDHKHLVQLHAQQHVSSSPVADVDEPTKPPVDTCASEWCRNAVQRSGTGRPPLYCSNACRKRTHAIRQRIQRLEDERLKKIAEDKRHTDERHQLAAEICTSIAQAPMTAAAALVDWMERNPAREWDMRSLRRRLDSALLSSQLEQLETKR